MPNDSVGTRIQRVLDQLQLAQRQLASETGISQSTLSRIISGDRTAKTPELASIAGALGVTVAELCDQAPTVRVAFATRATNNASMDVMRQQLQRYVELDTYLAEYGIEARR